MPSCHVYAHLCKYMYEWVEKTCYKFGKGHDVFYPIKLSRFAEKMKLGRNTRIS